MGLKDLTPNINHLLAVTKERNALKAENERLRKALEKIEKVGTIPWANTNPVVYHIEYWAKIAQLALTPTRGGEGDGR